MRLHWQKWCFANLEHCWHIKEFVNLNRAYKSEPNFFIAEAYVYCRNRFLLLKTMFMCLCLCFFCVCARSCVRVCSVISISSKFHEIPTISSFQLCYLCLPSINLFNELLSYVVSYVYFVSIHPARFHSINSD